MLPISNSIIQVCWKILFLLAMPVIMLSPGFINTYPYICRIQSRTMSHSHWVGTVYVPEFCGNVTLNRVGHPKGAYENTQNMRKIIALHLYIKRINSGTWQANEEIPGGFKFGVCVRPVLRSS
jgi:hypothetical protein